MGAPGSHPVPLPPAGPGLRLLPVFAPVSLAAVIVFLWVCFCFLCCFVLFFRLYMSVKSYGVCLSLSDLLHSA